MDTDTGKSDWSLVIAIILTGCRLIFQLHTLKKQARNQQITKENLEISSAVVTLVKLDRYVSEFLENLKRNIGGSK